MVEQLLAWRKEAVAGNRSAVEQTEEERGAEGDLRVVGAASRSEENKDKIEKLF